MRDHLCAAYPHEGCGVLVGRWEPLEVVAAVPGRNLHALPHSGYTLDPAAVVAADRLAGERGLALLGFFHSHPDAGPTPSYDDMQHAWPNTIYLILEVRSGDHGTVRSWVTSSNPKVWHELSIINLKDSDES